MAQLLSAEVSQESDIGVQPGGQRPHFFQLRACARDQQLLACPGHRTDERCDTFLPDDSAEIQEGGSGLVAWLIARHVDKMGHMPEQGRRHSPFAEFLDVEAARDDEAIHVPPIGAEELMYYRFHHDN